MFSSEPAYEIIILVAVPIVLLYIFTVYRGIKLGLYKETGIMAVIAFILFIFLPLFTPLINIIFLLIYNKTDKNKIKLICGNCGNILSESDNVCSQCGYRVKK